MFEIIKKVPENTIKIGWVTASTFGRIRLERMLRNPKNSVDEIRCFFVYDYINKNIPGFHNEIYNRSKRYDIVIFVKMMDEKCQEENDFIKSYGGKTIFDANVNYYEIWGENFIDGTRPTPAQQKNATQMTKKVDFVIADSTYIMGLAKKINPRTIWIPDNVNTLMYPGKKIHSKKDSVSLVWSGIAKKADHLLMLKDSFEALKGKIDIKLNVVSDQKPACLDKLQSYINCNFYRFSNKKYREILLNSDIIISPKRLCNSYEVGHTEYKITLGMAIGLPPIASPQQSYQEAIEYKNGGFIARTTDEWTENIYKLSNDPLLRQEVGQRATQTVLEKYQTSVIAHQYIDLFNHLSAK